MFIVYLLMGFPQTSIERNTKYCWDNILYNEIVTVIVPKHEQWNPNDWTAVSRLCDASAEATVALPALCGPFIRLTLGPTNIQICNVFPKYIYWGDQSVVVTRHFGPVCTHSDRVLPSQRAIIRIEFQGRKPISVRTINHHRITLL